jgi:PhoPQ-activated pathogenicity-related protein
MGRLALHVLLLSFTAIGAHGGARATRNQTALDRYVFAPDPNYRYELINTVRGTNVTSYILDLTSQQWRSAAEVDRPLWKHWLIIVVPAQVRTSTGFLFIDGGSNKSNAPKSANAAFLALAQSSQSVIANLRMIPSEPLTFKDESKPRTEDAIIAYTWDKFLRTGDETWPLRLPMAKAAVRAMDTVTAFCAAQEKKVKVDRFVVSGGSKRAWTTWAAAAVDDRVVAILPFVIDILNVEKAMDHHYRAYGFWAPSIQDYVDMHIMDWAGTPEYRKLMKIEDPYSYRERLTMPKYIVNSAGDQYFPPDSWQFYFNDLKGEKYLRYVPNTKHDLNNSDAIFSLQSFYEAFLNGTPRPRFGWKMEKNGDILVSVRDKPTEVKLWQATNPKARDFRLDTIGPAYRGTILSPQKNGSYVGRVSRPAQGWTAYFVELTFPSGGKYPFKFTTGVRITPDTLPSAPYRPSQAAITGTQGRRP